MTAQLNADTIYHRIAIYGYTQEEARNVPLGQPRWMWRIEQQHGKPFADVLREWRDDGLSLGEFCRKHQVAQSTLSHWTRKLGIQFKPKTVAGMTYLQSRAIRILANEIVLEPKDTTRKAIGSKTLVSLEVRQLIYRDDYDAVRLTAKGEQVAGKLSDVRVAA